MVLSKETKDKLKERNKLIIDLFLCGKKADEIRDIIIKRGFNEITSSRVWYIWRRSSAYFSKRKSKISFCNFCLLNKRKNEMYVLRKNGEHKVEARMCFDCFKLLIPKQPIQQNE